MAGVNSKKDEKIMIIIILITLGVILFLSGIQVGQKIEKKAWNKAIDHIIAQKQL